MVFGIRTKLFLVLLFSTAVVLLLSLGVTRWSLERGFVEYVAKRQDQHAEQIRQRLIEHYRERGDWRHLEQSKRAWLGLLLAESIPPFPDRHSEGARERFRAYRKWLDTQPPWLKPALRDRSGAWPPPFAVRDASRSDLPLPLELRIMLFDSDGGVIRGSTDLLSSARTLPLELDGRAIGRLAIMRTGALGEMGEIRFLEGQQRGLLVIALLAVLLSAGLAIVIARRLVQPLEALRGTARELAAGRFDARVPLSASAARGRSDELGRLAADMNVLAETLERNESARRQWAADIAHELRTPLGVLRGELEALQDGIRPLDRRAVDSLHADALRLGRLVDDLYELSMTDLGALSYRKAACAPAELLEDDVDAFRPRFKAAGLELETELDGVRALTLEADAQRLSQLYRNLLRNSLAYTDAGGRLRISALIENDVLLIDFQDTAPAVPDDALPRLFERLYRVDASRNRASGGAGLGLAIAHNIASAHGGELTARHSPMGGLWLRISLPLSHARSTP
ncbi:MAG: ATP-binding protein [Gammaproteobacteria bacterium]